MSFWQKIYVGFWCLLIMLMGLGFGALYSYFDATGHQWIGLPLSIAGSLGAAYALVKITDIRMKNRDKKRK